MTTRTRWRLRHYLAWALRDMGRYAEARELDEDTLARCRRVLGEDHPRHPGLGEQPRHRPERPGRVSGGPRAGRGHPGPPPPRARRGPPRHPGLGDNLAGDLSNLGEHQAARELDEDTLARRRRVLGEDHPDTLTSASNLAVDLSDLGRVSGGPRAGRGHPGPPPPGARRGPPRHPGLGEQSRRRPEQPRASIRRPASWTRTPWPAAAGCSARTTPSTLTSASNLAVDLRKLGEHQAARELDEDTLARRRRVLGEDHPDTLASANNLAGDLRDLGEHQAARELDEDTLARRRRVLGEDHPDTLTSASNLADRPEDLGEYQAARELDEDTLARFRRVLGEDHPAP